MSPESGQKALAALERVEPNLRGILQWFRIPPDDAQDLRQEILLALVRCWDRIESPEGWLISALFRQCARYVKQRKRQGRIQSLDAPALEALAPLREPDQREAEVRRDLRAVLRRLRPRERLALLLRYRGLSREEVAERLGCRPASVGKVGSRALAQAQRAARRLQASGGSTPGGRRTRRRATIEAEEPV